MLQYSYFYLDFVSMLLKSLSKLLKVSKYVNNAFTSSSVLLGIIANGTVTTGRINAGSPVAADAKNNSYSDITMTDVDANGDPFYSKQHKMPVADKGVHDVTNAARESISKKGKKIISTKKNATESLAAKIIRTRK